MDPLVTVTGGNLGMPNEYQAPPPEYVARFWSKVNQSGGPDACWRWLGKLSRDGYGRGPAPFRQTSSRRAHRVAYELHHAALIPPGALVLHDCDNPPCCNPAHLYLGSPADNAADRMVRGRAAQGDTHGSRLHPESRPRGDAHWTRRLGGLAGERNGRAKLTTDDVSAIRKAFRLGESRSSIARRLNMSWSAIHNIVMGLHWRMEARLG